MINVVNAIYGSNEEFLYRGEDCMDVFVQKMIEVKDKIMEKMRENKEIIFNNNNRIDFNNATQCYICVVSLYCAKENTLKIIFFYDFDMVLLWFGYG